MHGCASSLGEISSVQNLDATIQKSGIRTSRCPLAISARKRLELVIPVVLLGIFVLLYRTYGSAKEAAPLLLAVPFALGGGIFPVKAWG